MVEKDIGQRIAQPREINSAIGGGLGEQGTCVTTKRVQLNKNAWKKLELSPYFMDTVLEGVHFGLTKHPRRVRESNYVESGKEEMVDAKWKEWEEKGVIERGDVHMVMALGTVPKKNGKVRVVHNCKPLNKCVADMPYKLDGIAEVAKFLKKDDWMCSLDLQDGYEHVPIHPEWRKYFGVCWKGQIRRFARLGFGFKLSPIIFQSLMEGVMEEANRRIGYRAVFVYLDDFLIRGKSKRSCTRALRIVLKLLDQLGLRINKEKSKLEAEKSIEYLGKVWNAEEAKVYNTEARLDAAKSDCKRFLREGQATLQELESLLGRLEWLARTMPYSRCWKRSLLMEARIWRDLHEIRGGLVGGLGVRGQGSNLKRVFSGAAKRELRWWWKNADNRLTMDLEDVWKTRIKDIHTDASGYGYGSSDGLWGLWEAEEKDWNIAIKEMEAVRRELCRLESNSRTRIGVDNTVVFWSLKRGRSFCWELNNLVRRIGGDARARNLDLDFYWVASEQNRADWISRQWSRPSPEPSHPGLADTSLSTAGAVEEPEAVGTMGGPEAEGGAAGKMGIFRESSRKILEENSGSFL